MRRQPKITGPARSPTQPVAEWSAEDIALIAQHARFERELCKTDLRAHSIISLAGFAGLVASIAYATIRFGSLRESVNAGYGWLFAVGLASGVIAVLAVSASAKKLPMRVLLAAEALPPNPTIYDDRFVKAVGRAMTIALSGGLWIFIGLFATYAFGREHASTLAPYTATAAVCMLVLSPFLAEILFVWSLRRQGFTISRWSFLWFKGTYQTNRTFGVLLPPEFEH